MHTKRLSVNLKERDNLEDLEIYERIILKPILEKRVEWIHLASNRDKWRSLVNMVMNIRVP